MSTEKITRAARAAAIAVALLAAGACQSKSESAEQANVSAAGQADTAHESRDACALVTRSEMEQVLGKPVAVPKNGEDGDKSKCIYALPGSATAIEFDVDWNGGDAGWAGVTKGQQVLNNEGAGNDLGPITEPIPNLGDGAFIQSVKMPKISLPSNTGIDLSGIGGGQGVLWLRKGANIVSITVANQDDAKEKATAIARKALVRL